MATLERAIEIAARAHAGVRDKQGQSYILHPIRVMMGVESESDVCGLKYLDVVCDGDRPRIRELLQEALQGHTWSSQVAAGTSAIEPTVRITALLWSSCAFRARILQT